MKVVIEKLDAYEDARGFVFRPLEAEDLETQRDVHAVINLPGAVRGNHFHRQGTEILTVCGPAQVWYRENGSIRQTSVPEKEIHRFTFPPGIPHAIQNTGGMPQVLIASMDRIFDPENPDLVQEELIPPH